MSKYEMECLYCGRTWYVSGLDTGIRCRCGETKQIRAKEVSFETGDVFGYRFSPDFPAPKPAVVETKEPEPDRSRDLYDFINYCD